MFIDLSFKSVKETDLKKTLYLQFAPQSTLKAAYTIHDPGDVLKSQPEVILMNRRVTNPVITVQYINAFFYLNEL